MALLSRSGRLGALAALFSLSACGASLGEILNAGATPGGAAQQSQLTAEVQQVDTRRQEIVLRTQDGRTGSVLFDQNTVVVYRQQRYPVTALERGDVVAAQLQQTSQNALYASRIDVRQSVQERTGQGSPADAGSGQRQQFVGQVGEIDSQRGLFQLHLQFGGTAVVSLPPNAPSASVERFRRLRRGEIVRIEGTPRSSDRIELARFY